MAWQRVRNWFEDQRPAPTGDGTAIPADGARSTFLLSRWLFLRLLGIVYLVAFVSLWVQVDGLIGARGILPMGSFLEERRRSLGDDAYLLYPTMCWFAGDWVISLLCAAGALQSCLVIAGFLPGPIFVVLWASYLSLTVAGQVFLAYQWDVLLLEAGFLAIFYAPWSVWPGLARKNPPSAAVRWLYLWLLFRLMFTSGVVKLTSGDPTWRNLTALQYHFETQPLPAWTSWYMHQLPGWLLMLSALVMFFFELLVPLLLFGPRHWRHLACAGIAGFQLLIALTGNFGFFNLLTIVLCVPQLDDALWPAFLRTRLLPIDDTLPAQRAVTWRLWLMAPLVAGIVLLSLAPALLTWRPLSQWPAGVVKAYQIGAAFRVANPYGLFAVMTAHRSEIVLEGSADQKTWRTYEFRCKPGDVQRKPAFVAPHLPRLDWQMWFVPLTPPSEHEWFQAFQRRLLEGSPAVLSLLADNPFPDEPPRWIRAKVYEYHFTDAATRAQTGAWWRREDKGLFGRVMGRDGL